MILFVTNECINPSWTLAIVIILYFQFSLYKLLLNAYQFFSTHTSPNVLSSHFPLNPGNFLFPVSNSCIVPCFIAFFFSMSSSSEAMRASVSESTWAIADCSVLLGKGIINEFKLPFVIWFIVAHKYWLICLLIIEEWNKWLIYSQNGDL